MAHLMKVGPPATRERSRYSEPIAIANPTDPRPGQIARITAAALCPMRVRFTLSAIPLVMASGSS